MKHLKILAMLSITCWTLSCTTTSQKGNPQNEGEQPSAAELYTVFSENPFKGVKDNSGKIILPAEYDDITFTKDIIVAEKEDLTYFFNSKKSVFSSGVTAYDLSEKYITAYNENTDNTMMYFFKTQQTVENIFSSSHEDGVFLIQTEDKAYAFYTDDGVVKAQNLRDIFCLKKFDREGYHTGTRFAFKQPDQSYLIYTSQGDFLYKMELPLWQKIGMTYFTRDTDEYREYEWTYNYQIDMDQYVQDYRNKRMLTHYPAVD